MKWRIKARFAPLAGLLLAAALLGGCGGDYGPDQHGNPVSAQTLDKHWLVVNYWAVWCGPCRREIPELNALSQSLQGQGVRVLGVNFDNLQGEELSAAAQTLGIDFPVLAQDPAPRFALPRSQGLPVTYIIDDQGKLREQLMGEQTAAGIKERLAALQGNGN
ncbi:TlpA disulfide reductase family protein [Pseudomonas coleopterorum]|uniref:TlpA disulfide reductase family protein n=1 Tax=Pseudomonas coleopterorum TaxID=1605838 RepID=UPI001785E425|nr:TlpA disulfide reductase family protein [Pseudomonas coleopterorum]MBD8480669.1 TlpA family protein disulfide reductase [Pseudomonas coleopterorum]